MKNKNKGEFNFRVTDRIANQFLMEYRDNGVPLPKTSAEVISRSGVGDSESSRILYNIDLRYFFSSADGAKYLIGDNGFIGSPSSVAKTNVDPEPNVNVSELPKKYQEKLDIAVRKKFRELQSSFDQTVSAEVKRLIDVNMLPGWKRKIEYAEKMERSWRKDTYALSKEEYKKILVCLHPDRVTDESLKARYSEAFDIFKRNENNLVMPESPKDQTPPMPGSFDDIIKMNRKRA